MSGEEKLLTTVVVPASELWTDVEIDFAPKQLYVIRASGTWKDLTIETDANGYDVDEFAPPRRLTFEIAKHLRPLDTGSIWFSLIGRFHQTGTANRGKSGLFEIGDTEYIQFSHPGKLQLGANDVPLMYWNNSGELTVTISAVG